MSESQRQAGDEVEVTENMIEAGATELASYRYDLSNEADVVASIFRAMKRLSRNSA